MKSTRKVQRYRLEQRVSQKMAQRNVVIISFVGLALFTVTYLYFNIGTPINTRASANYPCLTFSNQMLISGTDGSENAIYRFSNVTSGIDALVKIKSISGGAVLTDIDYYSSGNGPAWQPSIQIQPSSTAYIDWEIKFKKAGTNIDTAISAFAITATDIKNYNENIQTFVSAENPTDYYRNPATPLNLTYADNMLEAIEINNPVSKSNSNSSNVLIQMNYTATNCLIYRTGAVNHSTVTESKLFNLFFKSFFSGTPYLIPAEVASFTGEKNINNTIALKWVTGPEHENSYYSISKSNDGKNFKELVKINAEGNPTGNNEYTYTDNEQASTKNYYCLSQTNFNGGFVKLKTICVLGSPVNSPVIIQSAQLNQNMDKIYIKYGCESHALLKISLTDVDGTEISSGLAQSNAGDNDFNLTDIGSLKKGVYFVSIDNYKTKFKTVKAIKY